MRFSLRRLIAIVTFVTMLLGLGMALTWTWRRQLAIRFDLQAHGASWVGFSSDETELIPNVLYHQPIVDDFRNRQRLGKVELKCFDVTPACIEKLCTLEHIESLHFVSCRLGDDDLAQITAMNVDNLLFWKVNLTDSAIDTLAQIRGLKKLTLVSTKLTPQGIDRLRLALPDVKIFSRP